MEGLDPEDASPSVASVPSVPSVLSIPSTSISSLPAYEENISSGESRVFLYGTPGHIFNMLTAEYLEKTLERDTKLRKHNANNRMGYRIRVMERDFDYFIGPHVAKRFLRLMKIYLAGIFAYYISWIVIFIFDIRAFVVGGASLTTPGEYVVANWLVVFGSIDIAVNCLMEITSILGLECRATEIFQYVAYVFEFAWLCYGMFLVFGGPPLESNESLWDIFKVTVIFDFCAFAAYYVFAVYTMVFVSPYFRKRHIL